LRVGDHLAIIRYVVDEEATRKRNDKGNGRYTDLLALRRVVYPYHIDVVNFDDNTLIIRGKEYKYDPKNMRQSTEFSFKTDTKIVGVYPYPTQCLRNNCV